MDTLSRRLTFAVLGAVASAIVALEVLVTRLLSLTTWYGLAFVVLSIAMLGLTGGSLSADRARRLGAPYASWVGDRLLLFAAALVLCAWIVVSVPIEFEVSWFASILLVTAAIALPMALGGSVVARLMAESGVAITSLYAVDLAAAACGALVPLAILGPLSAPGAIVALATVAALVAVPVVAARRRKLAWWLAAASSVVLALTELTPAGLQVNVAKGKHLRAHGPLVVDAWNPLSHLAVDPYRPVPARDLLWSPSPIAPATTVDAAWMIIDGEAGTVAHAYRDAGDLSLLRYDATTLAHVLRPDGLACVIGVGGGRDVLAALHFGHDRVYAAEINPSIVRALAGMPQTPLLRDPRVEIVVNDGRAAFAEFGGRCRTLQGSLVDTWAATSAGAFAHAETTLYTREAWSIFLKRVEPDGVFTMSRWYAPDQPSETARLLSLAIASLLDRGAADPSAHIALVASGYVATVLVSPAPLRAEDAAALARTASQMQFEVLAAPGIPPRDPVLASLLSSRSVGDLARAGAPYRLDTSAPTDDRPFFFQVLAPSAWFNLEHLRHLLELGPGQMRGNVNAMVELLLAFLAVAIVGAALIGPTLLRSIRLVDGPLPGARGILYFSALGAGFMIAEIALVQRMHLVLGHPTYALVFVLAGLLVATGIGSAVSPRLVRSRRDVALAAVAATALLAWLPYLISWLARATASSPLAVRAGWSALCAGILGLVLGTFFPSGLRFTSRDRAAAAALAVNGAASVIGSIAAIVVSTWYGIPAAFLLAALAYLVAAVTGPAFWPAAGAATLPAASPPSPAQG